jgi:hypothetical protein
MPKILSYQKITDKFTTHTLVEPTTAYATNGEARIVELCTIDGTTYVYIPDGVILPSQPKSISLMEEKLTDELKVKIKLASIRLINQRVVEKIREEYSADDEFKMLRLAPSEESALYNDHIEECRAWGRKEKEKLGL